MPTGGESYDRPMAKRTNQPSNREKRKIPANVLKAVEAQQGRCYNLAERWAVEAESLTGKNKKRQLAHAAAVTAIADALGEAISVDDLEGLARIWRPVGRAVVAISIFVGVPICQGALGKVGEDLTDLTSSKSKTAELVNAIDEHANLDLFQDLNAEMDRPMRRVYESPESIGAVDARFRIRANQIFDELSAQFGFPDITLESNHDLGVILGYLHQAMDQFHSHGPIEDNERLFSQIDALQREVAGTLRARRDLGQSS
jgi:hypothetical protein